MVFLIAGIPALAVLITYYITDSKAKTTVAALIAAAIGVFTGNPIYALLDLALVGGAYWIAISNLNDDEKARLEAAARLRWVEEMERSRLARAMANDAETGWEERCAAMDLADAERKAANMVKIAALRVKLEAERDAAKLEADRAAAAVSVQKAHIHARAIALAQKRTNSQRRLAHLAQAEAERLTPEAVTPIQGRLDQGNTK